MSKVTDGVASSGSREEVSDLVARQFSARAAEGLPLYRRFHETVEDLIRSGKLAPQTQMPPEQHLAAVLSISLGTVQKGLSSLSSKRLIVREHGRGTFVASARLSLTELRLFRFLDIDTETLLPVYATLLKRQLVGSTPDLVAKLGHDPEGYVQLTRLVDVGGRFTCYSDMHLPASLFGQVMQMPKPDFEDVNLKRLFSERLKIEADIYSHKVRLAPAPSDVRSILNLGSGAMVMEMEVLEKTSERIVTSTQKIFIPSSACFLDVRSVQHG